MRTTKSRKQQIQELCDRYRTQFGHGALDPADVVDWAIENNYLLPSAVDLRRALRHEVARAEREERIMDPQGRSVRRNHTIRDGDRTLIAEIDHATVDHMQMSTQQRRLGVLHDVLQLATDADSWNENYRKPGERTIQLSLNFQPDVDEMRESGRYPSEPPNEADDTDDD